MAMYFEFLRRVDSRRDSISLSTDLLYAFKDSILWNAFTVQLTGTFLFPLNIYLMPTVHRLNIAANL